MSRVLIYVLRRDLRLADNPVLHEIGRSFKQSHRSYTHVLPVYVVPAQQIEVSGFLENPSSAKSPFPEARSQVAKFWRCGPHRAKFIAESVWDLKKSLERVGSGLVVRVGMVGQVVADLLDEYKDQTHAVWMTSEEGSEEKKEERDVKTAAEKHGTEFKLWADEKYFVDDRDMPIDDIQQLPDVFTKYRNSVEPLRNAPRRPVSAPDSLPPLPEHVPTQPSPFKIPDNRDDFIECMIGPTNDGNGIKNQPKMPSGAKSAHPFTGGEQAAHRRMEHYISSGCATTYKDTRNGMLGEDFSTKLSAWLALGCITSRQVHEYLVNFEDGTTELGKGAQGYGKGENKGTGWVRFELLWRDYFRLCTRKYGTRLFLEGGFQQQQQQQQGQKSSYKWKSPSDSKQVADAVRRWLEGTTGLGLIDASQRELILTGYTSNRARQNVASFLAKHLGVDWRIGAEWYESMLIDYDVGSNWGNWQYTAGVGNDPRGEARMFNPVKQAFDYDPQGRYVQTWIAELAGGDVGVNNNNNDNSNSNSKSDKLRPEWLFQPSLIPEADRAALGLSGLEMVENPLKRINYSPGRGKGGSGGGRGGGTKGNRGGGSGGRGRGGRGRGGS